MTTVHDDPETFAEDQLAGWLALYADRVRGVPGGVIALQRASADPRVAVVIGGGSGHYPAFSGLVGPGLATGAVVGNVFTSPSMAQIVSVARAADQGRGVVLSFGNYAGDVMNFGLAAERLRADGIDTRVVVVTDDIASSDDIGQRRGIAGDFCLFKAMGAAAAEGASLDEVERVGTACNAATQTLGVAFSGCTLPGASAPLFEIPAGLIGLGLGIHGEPGIEDIPRVPASELASLLVERLLEARPLGAARRVAPILNGLGGTKYEELFLLWGRIAPLLAEAGVQVVEPEVGELVTSLDMGACSLTLQWLDDELERLWRADAYTPAYRKVAAHVATLVPAMVPGPAEVSGPAEVPVPAVVPAHAPVTTGDAAPVDVSSAREASRRAAATAREALDAVLSLLRSAEEQLGRIDAVAGDGDHGRGMVAGAAAARAAVSTLDAEAGVATLLGCAGDAWAEHAGGTSGVLWGAAIAESGTALGDKCELIGGCEIVVAAQVFAETIQRLGHASLGDKTMLDALLPFVDRLRSNVDSGAPIEVAWTAAARVAVDAAAATAELRPRVGRARPLAEKSVGTPDAGATSMAMILTRVGEVITRAGDSPWGT